MLMNAETLEFVSLAGVSISREVTSVPAPRDTARVWTENPVLVRTLPVRKLTDLKQLCKPCYLVKSVVLNILSIVSDQREGNCFLELIGGRCVPTYFYRMTNQECCCSGAAAWGPACSRCPAQGSSKLMIEVALWWTLVLGKLKWLSCFVLLFFAGEFKAMCPEDIGKTPDGKGINDFKKLYKFYCDSLVST